MEQIEKPEINLKTEKQDALIAKLIQSSAMTKTERDYIVDRISGRLITTKDAGILAAYLIAKIQFNKHFNDRRKHKIAACAFCQNKVSVRRYEEIKTGVRRWICSVCYTTMDKSQLVEVKKNKAVDVDKVDEGHIRAERNSSEPTSEEKEIYDDAKAEAAETRALENQDGND